MGREPGRAPSVLLTPGRLGLGAPSAPAPGSHFPRSRPHAKACAARWFRRLWKRPSSMWVLDCRDTPSHARLRVRVEQSRTQSDPHACRFLVEVRQRPRPTHASTWSRVTACKPHPISATCCAVRCRVRSHRSHRCARAANEQNGRLRLRPFWRATCGCGYHKRHAVSCGRTSWGGARQMHAWGGGSEPRPLTAFE